MPHDIPLSKWIADSRTAQGLPPVLTDTAAIERAADVFRVARRLAREQGAPARRSKRKTPA